ncbi:base excision DNA repair protein [Moelleriella libera RCEF 2490]|uniref:Base excision DNA repair protein n=1 Tax=Moelleriella libera RCEF 2490 TaxID=1081109 RepID=A0A168FC89_9HYPO|nr:base excision DNA repair protein [Moelleriella libera RCEF 2490]
MAAAATKTAAPALRRSARHLIKSEAVSAKLAANGATATKDKMKKKKKEEGEGKKRKGPPDHDGIATKKPKKEEEGEEDDKYHDHHHSVPVQSSSSSSSKADLLKARKLKSFTAFSQRSPFPSFPRPTPQDCRLAHSLLARVHGERSRPPAVIAPTNSAGCGDSPSVLDALVRTILSQNTSNTNSTRAKLSMDDEYGGSDRWEAIAQGGQARLEKAIQSGGLAAVKSRVIINILQQTRARYGVYSLDHLFAASDEDAMKEMIAFQGVGPKTASCVLLFCLQRASFAVDTHVHRITGLLGWRPPGASREETQAHLDAVVPDDEKYPLHVLLVTHGRRCGECKAGGRTVRNCELRKAFRPQRSGGVVKVDESEADAEEKEEEDVVVKNEQLELLRDVKKEEDDDDADD